MASPRVFTITASTPFVPTLIRALLDGRLVAGFPAGRDPLALADATLYLPTRRACRLARDLFHEVTGESAAILPRIVPIGDIDEDEIAFAQMATGALAADALDLPPALDGLERRMLLTRLVLEWASSEDVRTAAGTPLVANSPAAALALADDLARLMDDMITRRVPWDRLDDLVPEELDAYWQLTLRFLKVARETWPNILVERSKMEPADRRDRLIEAERARLAAKTDGPVIAAGSTGSMPATADLIATIAKLPHGAVVLPGLDTDLDAESWQLIAGLRDADGRELVAPAVGHPQYAMQALLRRIGVARDEVAALGTAAGHGRERYLSEALRPAIATDHWQTLATSSDFAASVEPALEALAVVEAANAEEEALAIALALREAIDDSSAESRERTAALVTPDRGLARRVLAALARWQVPVDDSGGDALADTAAGVFARLAAEAALGGLEPVTLLALLKHPFCRLGAADGAQARAVAALERAVLRGPRPRPGSAGLRHALATFRAGRGNLHRSDPRVFITEGELDAAAELVERLAAALAPLEALASSGRPFAELAAAHRKIVAALGKSGADEAAVFAGADGVKLHEAFEEIADHAADTGFIVAPGDYADLFRTIVADRVVRRPGQPSVRLRIYGPLEARLQSVDRMVLGAMVEGVWPPDVRSDPWLSRPMRQALGLDLPERRISLSAHDFAQALGAKEVVLSYPAKRAGAPTVPSRFVQRLAAVAGEPRWEAARNRGHRYLDWARALDQPEAVKRTDQPAPKPPRAARPSALSVTAIEDWLRDPYTIYAKYILKLPELDPIDMTPGAADRGIVIHGALSEFTKTYAAALPADPARALLDIGAKHFAALKAYPEAGAFWWPRFIRIAHWLAAWEFGRRTGVVALDAEARGSIPIPLGERTFTLSARADRIERRADGSYAILDYKTGTVPSDKQVSVGIAPQLTLEAAILRRGGFSGIAAGASVAELVYVSVKGRTPAGEADPVKFKDGDANTQADRALAKLAAVAARFEDEQQPYRSLVLSMWKNRYGTYDHLARVKEWSIGRDEDEIGGAP
jgi:ATP-dependent helicase/nuclease subunit B